MSGMLLPKSRLPDAFKLWQGDGWEIHAPKKNKNKVVFGRIKNAGEAELEALLPDIPVKQLVFPQSEDISCFDVSPPGNVRSLNSDNRVIAFGIRNCDARGIKSLDPVFEGTPADPHYVSRRKNIVLVGIACNKPGQFCRCTSTGGSPHGTDGFDLQLVDTGEGYNVKAITATGEELASCLSGVASGQESGVDETAGELARAAEESMQKTAIQNGEALERVFEGPGFKKMALSCIRCGTCAYVCPTCHCFDIQDVEYIRRGRRYRCWDTCMYPEYSLHASGHNPRPTRWDRWRNRMSCKFWYIEDNWGEPGCVGCGRCVVSCPVNIDIFECAKDVVSRDRK